MTFSTQQEYEVEFRITNNDLETTCTSQDTYDAAIHKFNEELMDSQEHLMWRERIQLKNICLNNNFSRCKYNERERKYARYVAHARRSYGNEKINSYRKLYKQQRTQMMKQQQLRNDMESKTEFGFDFMKNDMSTDPEFINAYLRQQYKIKQEDDNDFICDTEFDETTICEYDDTVISLPDILADVVASNVINAITNNTFDVKKKSIHKELNKRLVSDKSNEPLVHGGDGNLKKKQKTEVADLSVGEGKFEKEKLKQMKTKIKNYEQIKLKKQKIEDTKFKNTNNAEQSRYNSFMERFNTNGFKNRCAKELLLLFEVVIVCEFIFGLTRRREWLYFLINDSSMCYQYNNKECVGANQNRYKGCGKCNKCKMRTIKSIIVLRACQGLSDQNVLPRFEYIFNINPIYNKYTIDDWLNISERELTILYWACSCQYKCAVETVTVLKELKRIFNAGETFTSDLSFWCNVDNDWTRPRFRGFGKKTCILILTAVFGYTITIGIATDRHVVRKSVDMDWLCKKFGKATPHKICPYEVNKMLEYLFDAENWGYVNDILGSLSQYDIIDCSIIDEALSYLEDKHCIVIKKFRSKN